MARTRGRFFITRGTDVYGEPYFLAREQTGSAGRKMRYRAIHYPDGRYLPPVYDPRRIRVRGDHGQDNWISIEERDIVTRFKTYAEAQAVAEQMTAEARDRG